MSGHTPFKTLSDKSTARLYDEAVRILQEQGWEPHAHHPEWVYDPSTGRSRAKRGAYAEVCNGPLCAGEALVVAAGARRPDSMYARKYDKVLQPLADWIAERHPEVEVKRRTEYFANDAATMVWLWNDHMTRRADVVRVLRTVARRLRREGGA